MAVDDRYTYPDSGGVLVNKLGIKDPALLDLALNDAASLEWNLLCDEPIPAAPGFDYLRTIHERLFGEVLPFAGQLRDVDVQAVGTGIPYCRPDYIRPELDRLFGQLRREDFLAGASRSEFPELLAERWGDLSAIHPFRDGNTRSQSLYVSKLSERAGFTLDWRELDVDELRDRRLAAVVGRTRPLAEMLDRAIVEHSPQHDPDRSPLLRRIERARDEARTAAARQTREQQQHTPTAEQPSHAVDVERERRGIER